MKVVISISFSLQENKFQKMVDPSSKRITTVRIISASGTLPQLVFTLFSSTKELRVTAILSGFQVTVASISPINIFNEISPQTLSDPHSCAVTVLPVITFPVIKQLSELASPSTRIELCHLYFSDAGMQKKIMFVRITFYLNINVEFYHETNCKRYMLC